MSSAHVADDSQDLLHCSTNSKKKIEKITTLDGVDNVGKTSTAIVTMRKKVQEGAPNVDKLSRKPSIGNNLGPSEISTPVNHLQMVNTSSICSFLESFLFCDN